MIIPYKMETTFVRMPVANSVLIALTSTFFFLVLFGVIPEDAVESMVLRDWDIGGMIGSLFLHGGLLHLLGNMLFLWIFGSAVCAAVGNAQYCFLYFFLGIVASAAHLAFNGYPAIGASGAINGVVGMSLVLFPVNRLNCFYFFSFPFLGIFWKSGKFVTKAFWMILFWLVFDIAGAIFGGGNIAYWAHLGGFGAGMFIGFSLIMFNVIETYDPTLIDVLTGKATERETYDMDQLAERIRTKKKQEQVPFKSDPILAQLLPSDTSIQPAASPKEPLPNLRVLKTTTREKDVFVYFINEGDTVSNATIGSEDTIIAEINPKTLSSKSPGWMKFINSEYSVLQNVNLFISYDDGEGRRTSKQMTYDGSGGRFHVA